MKFRLLITLLVCCSSGAATATDYVLHAGRMVDVKEGRVTEEVTITVSGNRITAVEKGYREPSATEQLIDLKDQTVMPGLMDMHVHLTTEMSPTMFTEKFLMESADYAFRSKVLAERTLLAGFTTVREMGDQDRNLGAAMKRAIAKGYIHGPRIHTAGKGLATTGGLADYSNGVRHEFMGNPGPVEGVVNGPLSARQAVRQRFKDGADLIKINLTGGSVNPRQVGFGPQWRPDELEAVVETAADYNMTVAAHAVSAEGIERAINAGVTSVEHGTFLDERLARLMKEKGIAYVPTLTAIKWIGGHDDEGGGEVEQSMNVERVDVGARIDQSFAMAYKAGVWIVFGSDAGVFPNGLNANEFGFMVAAGMKPMEAVQSATIEGAKLLRIDDALGSIETGKLADIVAVRGDPLADMALMKSIAFVMKDGTVYKQDGKVVLPIGDIGAVK